MTDEEQNAGRRSAPGRRRANRAGDDGRRHRVVLTCTDDEYRFLFALAAAQGISIQRALMAAAQSGGVEAAARYAELAEDVRAVGRLHARLTSLLNQLARVANSTGEVPAEMAAATAAVEKANGRVHEVLARVEEQVGSR